MSDELLYHLAEPDAWAAATAEGGYRAASLEREVFIHCSTAEQVAGTVGRFYRDRTDLVVLVLDPKRLRSQLRYERADGLMFPHVYGPINLDAVVAEERLRRADDGSVILPRGG